MRHVGLVVAVAGSMLWSSVSRAADIRCKGIEATYQPLLDGTMKGINTVMDGFNALEKQKEGLESKRETLRKRYCAVSGEALGLYRALAMQIDACAAAGENLDTLPKDVKEYLDTTQNAVTKVCG